MADAYDGIELRISWSGCSLALFGVIVAILIVLPYMIVSLRTTGWFGIAAALLFSAAAFGTVAGVVSLRRRGASLFGIAGVALNGLVLTLILVTVVSRLVG